MSSQPTEWEKICVNDVIQQGFNCENIQSAHTAQEQQQQKTKTPIEKKNEQKTSIDISPKKT